MYDPSPAAAQAYLYQDRIADVLCLSMTPHLQQLKPICIKIAFVRYLKVIFRAPKTVGMSEVCLA